MARIKSVWQANIAGLRTEWGLEITLLWVFDIFTQKVKQLSQNKSFMIRTFSLQNWNKDFKTVSLKINMYKKNTID